MGHKKIDPILVGKDQFLRYIRRNKFSSWIDILCNTLVCHPRRSSIFYICYDNHDEQYYPNYCTQSSVLQFEQFHLEVYSQPSQVKMTVTLIPKVQNFSSFSP